MALCRRRSRTSFQRKGCIACLLKTCCPKGKRRHSVRAEYRATRGVEPLPAEPEPEIPVLDLDEDTELEDGVRTFTADPAAAGKRLDAYLAQAIPEIISRRGCSC